jgi:hypothetical protein
MAYTTIDNPSAYFNTKLISSASEITSVGHQADMIWLKSRTNDYSHELIDTVRGITKKFKVDDSGAESTTSTVITAIGSDSYTVGSGSNVVYSGSTGVGWSWKAGTSFTNDASATSIGTLDSSGSRDTDAGFSIISFTGTETSSQSVAHGLGAVPELIISKSRDVVDNWMVYHSSFSAQDYISLNLTSAKGSSANVWSSVPTSTVINIGDNAGVNDDGAMIMYAFRSVQGYSKFDSYTGNGNANGPFIYTGFRPAFVLQKSTAVQGWQLQDNKREGYNGDNDLLQPHVLAAESGVNRIDILSNGFKVITTDAGQNTAGQEYIFMAFAEAPFVTSTGVPGNAR